MSIEEQPRIEEVTSENGKAYLPPCQVRCPLDIDIQRNHAMIALLPFDADLANDRLIDIGKEVYEKSPLFPLLCSYICGLCEKECNYEEQTGAVRRRMIMRPAAMTYVKYLDTVKPFPAPTKEKVAVIGGGPGGLMCAYELSKRDYHVTVFERNPHLGGAMRLIPAYRLPHDITDSVINNLIRIANIEVKLDYDVGSNGRTMDDLKKEGFQAFFIATGTPMPRVLTIESEASENKKAVREVVNGADADGVIYGLNLLYEMLQGNVPLHLYKGKKVIVIGGGNVAFDVARTARRLGGEVTLSCLENADKSSPDGIPADDEEIDGAIEEGIKIIYSRGIQEIISKRGKFRKVKCLRCTSVYEEDGAFSPKFDWNDVSYIEGDVLLITIGQGPERGLFQNEGLLNEKGRMDIDPVTLMSNLKKGVFIGGDVRKIGFASESMRDGAKAAESIDRYISGRGIRAGREEKEYETASIPERVQYKLQPSLKWTPAKARINFEPFEKAYDLHEVIKEAKRCLYCGPCKSCKGCVTLGLQDEIAEIVIDTDKCSGCGVCVAVCPYNASKIDRADGKIRSVINDNDCKRCGVCVSVCPSNARSINDQLEQNISEVYSAIAD